MLILFDHPDLHVCSRENVFAKTAAGPFGVDRPSGRLRRDANYDLMAATNAAIARISFCVIMSQQLGLGPSPFGIAGTGGELEELGKESGVHAVALLMSAKRADRRHPRSPADAQARFAQRLLALIPSNAPVSTDDTLHAGSENDRTLNGGWQKPHRDFESRAVSGEATSPH
jgi:hypothetical protein